ncbi:MAG: DUF898 family protein [Clostridiales bacterium]|nr:DUF898 family protein [Clostridiales bacterium]
MRVCLNCDKEVKWSDLLCPICGEQTTLSNDEPQANVVAKSSYTTKQSHDDNPSRDVRLKSDTKQRYDDNPSRDVRLKSDNNPSNDVRLKSDTNQSYDQSSYGNNPSRDIQQKASYDKNPSRDLQQKAAAKPKVYAEIRSDGESKFDAGLIELIATKIIRSIIVIFTLGLAYPWAVVYYQKWVANHTIIDGQRQVFTGTGGQLFGQYIKWLLLSVVTFGIYSLWLGIKIKQWTVKNTHNANNV